MKKVGRGLIFLLIAVMSLWICSQAMGATAGTLSPGTTILTPVLPGQLDVELAEPEQDTLKPDINILPRVVAPDIVPISKIPAIIFPKGGEVFMQGQPLLVEYSIASEPDNRESEVVKGTWCSEWYSIISVDIDDTMELHDLPCAGVAVTGEQIRVIAYWGSSDNSTEKLSAAFSISDSKWSSQVKAVPGDNSVVLSWDSIAAAPGKVSYTILRSKEGGDWKSITDFPVKEAKYTDNTVQNNAAYTYRVIANIGDKMLNSKYKDVSVTPASTLVFTVGSTTIVLNGVEKEIDSPPVIVNGRTFVPLRALVENIGGNVAYDAALKKITFSYKDKTIVMRIGDTAATVNGVPAEVDVPPYISDEGRTMIPLRFIVENLGLDVLWDNALQSITIKF